VGTRHDDQDHRPEQIALTRRRGRPKTVTRQGEALLLELYKRALDAAKELQMTVLEADVPDPWALPKVKAVKEKVQKAWDLYWQSCKANGFPLLPPGDNRFRMKLRFPGETYEVDAELTRRCGDLLQIWNQFVAGRRNFRSAYLTVMRVGVMRDFGDLFDPPVDRTYKGLARRFKKPQTTIQSYLRRYREITSRQSGT
jgi:hypothetical protein